MKIWLKLILLKQLQEKLLKRKQMQNNLLLKQENASDRHIVGLFLSNLLETHPYIKELKSNYIQQWAKNGLLKSFSRVFFNSEPNTENLVVWFMDRVFMDLSQHKNSTKKQMKQFIDFLSKKDIEFLENMAKIAGKYNLEITEFINNSKNLILEKTINDDDSALLLFSIFADAIIHSEVLVFSYLYEQWFGEKYNLT